jgi:hypothetical protein
MIRVLRDNPTLPAGLLGTYQPGVFRTTRASSRMTELSTEDLFRIWVIQHVYQLSVPYVARMVEIESRQLKSLYGLVGERVNDVRPIIEVRVP